MHPSSQISTTIVVLVAALAVLIPVVTRVVSSPLLVLLISPFLLLLFAAIFAISYVFLGHFLDSKRPRQRNVLQSAARPFIFSTPAAWQAATTRSKWSHKAPESLPPLYPENLTVSSALSDIIAMIVRDFVMSWYSELSTSPSFPAAMSTLIRASLERLIQRASTIDIPVLIVKRILPKVTAHIDQFRESEMALRGAGLERRLTQSEELDLLLASRYSSKGGEKLHPAIDNLSTTFTKQTEEMHLKLLVEKALPFILPEAESKSQVLNIAAREIVACAILYPVMDMLADPDFWNQVIDHFAGAAIHQRKLVTKVRNVLEAQSPRSHRRIPTFAPGTTETITIHTDTRQFESFLHSINRLSSLLDARRLKSDIVGEIRRTRMLLANHDKEDWINGERTEDVVAFLDRLYTAKRKVEQRIVVLGGEDDSASYQELAARPRLTLRDVLGNPSSLSYFMEFMDRRKRSILVQFWLTVESFKNPLESVDSDSEEDEDETIQEASGSDTIKEDICMIHDLYFSGSMPQDALSCISKKHSDIIISFAKDELTPLPATERRVRRSVMLAQRQVEREMEQDFEDFERSQLWFKVLGDTEFKHRKSEPPAHGTSKHRKSSSSDSLSALQPSPDIPSKSQHTPHRPEFSPHLGFMRARTTSNNSSQASLGSGGQPTSISARTGPSNIELLMSPPLESTRAPLFDDPEDLFPTADEEQLQRMEAIQAALNDIIALEKKGTERPPSPERGANLRLPGSRDGARRRVIFDDDNDVDVDDPSKDDQPDEGSEGGRGSFQLAAPGDLQLSYEIARITEKISSLMVQDSILNSLIKKAELTGDAQELRLLKKSKSSMSRDLRNLEFQKLQYEQQEIANRLVPERTEVSIASSAVGDEDGKSVVRYLVEVKQLGSDGSFSSGWVVARRYNEFLKMHNRLKERYALVRNLDFPGKRLMTALSTSFVDSRRIALEKYLQSMVSITAVCESDEFRAFLSRDSPFAATDQATASKRNPGFSAGKDLVRTVYRSVAQSVDDMLFGPSMLDIMILRLTRQAAEFVGIVGSAVNDEDLVAQALKASGKSTSEDTLLQLSGDLKPLEGETSTSIFSAPICDLVLAIFELNKQNNWLRRQAIAIILQQVLGGTIERKIRETAKSLLEESRLMMMIDFLRDNLWPNGVLKPPAAPRSIEEKMRTRDEANRKLSSLLPELAANVLGRSNARKGARRIFAVLQNRRLNQHIAYVIIDEIFAALFPQAFP